MTTTTTVDYQTIITNATDGELSLGLVYNTNPAVRDMARAELYRRASRINADVDGELSDAMARSLGHIADTTRYGTQLCGVTVTRQAIINALHRDALTTRAHQAHLTTRATAVRYLADLIDQHRMDGEDTADMADDAEAGMTLADRGAYAVVYEFLLAACDAFDESGYDLVQSATVTVLGWLG
jgi:hypothetical protein